jgi:2-keto-3-deoxy-6-phosphogluconate aldolase
MEQALTRIGVDLSNLAEFIAPRVHAAGGGRLCDRRAVNEGNYGAITGVCVQSRELVKKIRTW